jgi:hypothetical protein
MKGVCTDEYLADALCSYAKRLDAGIRWPSLYVATCRYMWLSPLHVALDANRQFYVVFGSAPVFDAGWRQV